MTKVPLVEIKNLTKEYDGDIILKGIDLTIHQNEFVTLLGPSGCGKTTLLRIIGGFDTPTSGEVKFDGKDLIQIPSYKREINTVFQKYALFPHLNVFDNIAFGLRMKKVPESEVKERVNRMLKMVKLFDYANRRIDSLSGGQQQRIAIARALVNRPKVLLLDEPLGALDLKLRQDMQYELKEIQREMGITFIFVTHDQEEALTMSDTIVVLNDGLIQQIGTPVDIYNEPRNRFVANFIGESNIVRGVMLEDYKVEFENHVFECVDRGYNANEVVDIVIRPEDLQIVSKDKGAFTGVVDTVIFKGVHYEIIVMVEGREYIVHSTQSAEVGAEVGMTVAPADIHVMEVGV
ncbi:MULTISPECIES: spermidine/putrescine ABC transporter ATP-binding protein [Turicibacter]|jgi:spermidine/putrescine ABC transporter, ATP-binding protein PotA|uniref:Spermidine/putrescine import ATP-binding protein PotA n=2 Tax=Turicibacter sanguinis TaxID=154288 RepID=A0A173UKD2_9FIRM|nr:MULTISPECIES: spermidine/putrescine ABC transporter ATP-binding protein [Turicibacter]EFF65264.1 polyamine ABC transporter, ATP-binding protein [Turicibacter sanguinis PC909]EGC90668.1 spermidine/putrescine ABC transporter, ATP-binding protein PotA [Turicibacter sp. HGF1]MBP3904686.1 ABC transporter ATP-binding protein [Turicibacter sp.]MCU7191813.1 ABC transporter ATP-binding protein [Turicibacter sanguinis]MCU7197879.1 ABC transporter ATP-binding protein [Turicibacter sanguinis]